MSERLSVQQLAQMPDTRLTIDEAAEAAFSGYFSEGKPVTLLPEGVPERAADDWQKRLLTHVQEPERGGYPHGLAEHHVIVNLPPGASAAEQHALVQAYAREQFTNQDLLAHYVLHSPHDFDPDHPGTPGMVRGHQIVVEAQVEETGEIILIGVPGEQYPHAHIAVPVYPLEADGSFADQPHARWDDPDIALHWRREWSEEWERFREEEQDKQRDRLPGVPMEEVQRETEREAQRQALADRADSYEEAAQQAMMREVVAVMADSPAYGFEDGFASAREYAFDRQSDINQQDVNQTLANEGLHADEVSRIEAFEFEDARSHALEVGDE